MVGGRIAQRKEERVEAGTPGVRRHVQIAQHAIEPKADLIQEEQGSAHQRGAESQHVAARSTVKEGGR
jgi:hypothetical protein